MLAAIFYGLYLCKNVEIKLRVISQRDLLPFVMEYFYVKNKKENVGLKIRILCKKEDDKNMLLSPAEIAGIF